MPARNDFENEPETAEPSASSPPEAKSANFQIERPDWRLFGSLGSLGQKAGVPATKLRRLCLKELVDNDLDAGARATIEQPKPGHYSITDDGHGIDGLRKISPGYSASIALWYRPSCGESRNAARSAMACAWSLAR